MPWLRGAAAAFVLFASAAGADTTPPQLVNFSVSPLSIDTSAGPATLTVTIGARDDSNGFDTNSTDNGSVVFTHESGTTAFGRHSLPITGGTATNPIFQFIVTVPQFSPSGAYRIGLTLVDKAFNTATFDAAGLQIRGFPSSITVTPGASTSITLNPSGATLPAAGGSGSVQVIASSSGFSWSAVSNASWLTITSGAFGTGNGTVTYSAAANNSPAARTAAIAIGGQTFSLTEAAASSSLTTTAGSLLFTYRTNGGAPPPQTITVYSSNGAPLNFTASASSAGNWLFVSPQSGVTSTILSVWTDPTGLSAGTYTGTVVVAGSNPSNGSETETVTLVVNGSPAVAIAPSALSFSYQQSGSNPPPQILSVTAGAATGFTASASSAGGWLAVNPASAMTPATLSVSVFPSALAPGTYTGAVAISAASGVRTIPVTLVVATAQAIAISPSSFTFTYTLGGTLPPAQGLFLSGAASGQNFSALAASAGNWLRLGSSSVTAPGGLSVSADPSGLTPGVYSGAITLTGDNRSTQTVPATLVVTTGPAFTVTPASLTFNSQGSTVTPPQFLSIGSADSFATFRAVASSWIVLGPSGSFPAGPLSVSVNPAGLTPGTYFGSVTVGTTTSSQTVPVTLILSAASITANPGSLTFTYQPGGLIPASQNVAVNSGGATLNFTATAGPGSWLSMVPFSGATPAALTVSVAPSGLAPGTYTAAITITAQGAASNAQIVPVTLIVDSAVTPTVSPTTLQINYQVGDPPPSSQSLSLAGSGGFTATASSALNWLAVSPASGVSPATLNVQLNPSGLAAGTYAGVVRIVSGGSTQTVTVSLNVRAPQDLILSPSSLSFTYLAGGSTPAPQNITVGCSASALSFRPAATSLGNWLAVAVPNGAGNNQVIVSVNPAGLSPRSYSGTVTIFGVGACNSSQNVPVTLVVNSAQSPVFSPLSFSYQVGGGNPAPQAVSIDCGSAAMPFTTASSAGWLRVNPSSGATPATINVSVDPAGLAVGSYSGTVSIGISGTCGGSPTVSVSLVVSAGQPAISSSLAFSAGSLSFTAFTGGAGSAPQTVSLTCSGAAAPFTATATSNGSWLSINPASGTTPGTLTVSVNPSGLAAGTYIGSLGANAGACGSASPLPVSLIVSAAPVLTIIPASLAFNYQIGAVTPASQTLSLAGGVGLAISVTASSTGGWLFASSSGAAAPATVNVSVNPAGLAAGTYSGLITIASSTASSGASQNIAVSLTISGTAAPPAVTVAIPFLGSLVNAGSLLASPLAPGEIISIFGRGLGPVDSVPLRITPSRLVDNSLAGTRVLIDGKAAPILFTQAGQVNAIVPYSVAGQSTIQLQLEYQGVRSDPALFSVLEAAPAIFTIDASGRGQGAILNQDTSVNSDLNPADRGSIAVLYATGAGQMLPASADGSISGTALARPLALVSVLVDGREAEVTYAGSAPGLVAGVLQVNFRLPQQVRSAATVGLLLKVGRLISQPGVTVAIR